MNLTSNFYVFALPFFILITWDGNSFVSSQPLNPNQTTSEIFLTQNYISEPHLNELLIEGMEKGIQGNYQGAIADFTEIIRINPQEVEAYYNRGIAYAKLQDYPKAIADFNQGITLNQTIAELYLERAKVYLKLGEKSAAIADLKRAKQLFNQQGNTPRSQEVQRLLR
ncbi:MAG: tetratricopeptide repeat protein [Crocosphaera sp.]|nr:tetratricopeptide repeat protein [Crocosphaera sp.]